MGQKLELSWQAQSAISCWKIQSLGHLSQWAWRAGVQMLGVLWQGYLNSSPLVYIDASPWIYLPHFDYQLIQRTFAKFLPLLAPKIKHINQSSLAIEVIGMLVFVIRQYGRSKGPVSFCWSCRFQAEDCWSSLIMVLFHLSGIPGSSCPPETWSYPAKKFTSSLWTWAGESLRSITVFFA